MPGLDKSVPFTLLILAVAACGSDAARGGDGSWRAQRDTMGDTVVVRTLEGSAWGDEPALVEELRIGALDGPPEITFGGIASLAVDPAGRIHVVDAQAKTVRVFAPNGAYLRSIGREGQGPGELRRPHGIAFLPDGRLLVRDFDNARINVYTEAGEFLDSWPIPGGFSPSHPLQIDTAGHTYTLVIVDRLESMDWRLGLLHFDASGTIVDTLRVPDWEYDPPYLTAIRRADGRQVGFSRYTVPFTGTETWAFSPLGYFVGGVSTRYAIDLYSRDQPVLRIERTVRPVAVLPEERADRERVVTAAQRRAEPGWRWNGPPIPELKPPFRSVRVDDDGRIWVDLYQRGRLRNDAAEIPDVEEDGSARSRWTQPLVYDIYEPDGRFLGTVRLPDRFDLHVARGDLVWGVIRDEYEVEYVVRYRLTRSP